MKVTIRITAANGTNEFTLDECRELGRVTEKLDRAGTNYDLEFKNEEND